MFPTRTLHADIKDRIHRLCEKPMAVLEWFSMWRPLEEKHCTVVFVLPRVQALACLVSSEQAGLSVSELVVLFVFVFPTKLFFTVAFRTEPPLF